MSSKIPNLLTRNCPECNSVITYSSKYTRKYAEKRNSKCKECVAKSICGKNNPMYNMTGSLNPFYGKSHTDKTKKIIKENRLKNSHIYKSKEFREKMSEVTIGENNPMYGKSFYDCWLEKYGKDVADQKMIEFKSKISKANSGKNNPMYGVSPSNSAGSGWSGWYKKWYFRSLRELSYMINVIERFNLSWKSGELKEYKIPYILENTERTYKPDFIINHKYMIEIKPKQLHNTKEVLVKKKAAEKFCSNNGLIYKLRDVKTIGKDELIELESIGLVKLNSNYKQKLYKF